MHSYLLLQKGEFDIPSKICQWITNSLTGRKQYVKLGPHFSDSMTISSGVPQGCILSSFLYFLDTKDFTTTQSPIKIKFMYDTTAVGLIANNRTTILKKAQQRTFFLQQFRKLCISTTPEKVLKILATTESVFTASITVWSSFAFYICKTRLQQVVPLVYKIIGC